MHLPGVQLIFMDQEQQSLGAHTQKLQQLAYLTHFPDRLLIIFYLTSLNKEWKVQLSSVGPRGSFTEFVKWELENHSASKHQLPTGLQPHSHHSRICYKTQKVHSKALSQDGHHPSASSQDGHHPRALYQHGRHPRASSHDGHHPRASS